MSKHFTDALNQRPLAKHGFKVASLPMRYAFAHAALRADSGHKRLAVNAARRYAACAVNEILNYIAHILPV